jgi:hypothetical protein
MRISQNTDWSVIPFSQNSAMDGQPRRSGVNDDWYWSVKNCTVSVCGRKKVNLIWKVSMLVVNNKL